MGDREHRRLGAAGIVFVGLALCLLAVTGATVALGAKGDLRLVSRQSEADGGAGANSWSYGPSVSDDGRFVAFRSEATNLGIYASGSFETTVYVYDFKQRRVETVSRESNFGLGADGDSREEQISGNGRFVVFRTDAKNLGGPIVADENIYVYDRRTDSVELISRRSTRRGGGGANQTRTGRRFRRTAVTSRSRRERPTSAGRSPKAASPTSTSATARRSGPSWSRDARKAARAARTTPSNPRSRPAQR